MLSHLWTRYYNSEAGCIKKLYTLGFKLISQLKIQFQQSFYTFSMCQTHGDAKKVQTFIPTTKSDQDIEKMVKRTINKFHTENIYLQFNGLICLN
jgi:hypothetical protein